MTRSTARSESLPPLPARVLAPVCLALAIVVLALVVLTGGGSSPAGSPPAPSGWGADQTAAR